MNSEYLWALMIIPGGSIHFSDREYRNRLSNNYFTVNNLCDSCTQNVFALSNFFCWVVYARTYEFILGKDQVINTLCL